MSDRLELLMAICIVFLGLSQIITIIDFVADISKPQLIYIAGKYSGTPEQIKYNVQQAELVGMEVANKCNYPLVPHLLGYMSQENHTYSYWTNLDNIGLEKANAILLISHSQGADAEFELAKSLHKTIYYSIDEIPDKCQK